MIIYCGGTFDHPHAGHVYFLRQCAHYGKVIVSLNTDEFVERFKGKRPIMSYFERETVLREYKSVWDVIPNIGGEDSKPTILSVKPDYIIVGSDWEKKDYYKQMSFTQQWLDKNNIKLLYVPYTVGISTSEIKKRI